jgi:hypothetical protein
MDEHIRDAVTSGRLRVAALTGRKRSRTETLTPRFKAPRGAVTVVVGVQGIGKGTIISRIVSDETLAGHGVGIVSDEDSIEATILPRLQAAGADLDRVHVFEAIDPDDIGVLVPRDNAEIAAAVERYEMRLLILDPWTNHLDVPDIDKGHVRKALMPFAKMCRDSRLAALLSAHPNRRDTDDPLTAIAHASAVSQVARAAYHVVIDPTQGTLNQKENHYRLLIHAKANLTAWGDTLRYRLVPTLLTAEDGQPEVDTVRAEYDGVEDAIPDYAAARQGIRRLERAQPSEADDRTAEGRAKQFLLEYLAAEPRSPEDVKQAAEHAGHSKRTIERARKSVADSVTVTGTAARLWKLRPSRQHDDTLADGELGELGELPYLSQSMVLPAHEAAPFSPSSPSSPSANGAEIWREAPDMDGGW